MSSHDEPEPPTIFRVVSAGPNPLPPEIARFDHFVLTIEESPSGRKTAYGVDAQTFIPYQDAVDDAVASGLSYWVDLDFSKQKLPPPQHDATVPQRLLRAILNRQFASDLVS